MNRDHYSDCVQELSDRYNSAIESLRRVVRQNGYKDSLSENWIYFSYPLTRIGPVGWKAHISCCTKRAPELISLLANNSRLLNGLSFKVADRIATVLNLNMGRLGETQVGKIVTVYESEQSGLAEAIFHLSKLWRDPGSPIVSSDLQLTTNPSFSFRYGGNSGASTKFDQWGVPRLVYEFSGQLFEDNRRRDPAELLTFSPPLPCEKYLAVSPPAVFEVQGKTFHVIRTLYSSVKGAAYFCSTEEALPVIVKTARRGVFSDALGFDARTRLFNEARLLKRLEGARVAPNLFAFEPGEMSVLVRADIPGSTLSWNDIRDPLILHSLVTKLSELHSLGATHRDLKSDNVIVKGKDVVFIDFELSSMNTDDRIIPGGTPNYFPKNDPVCRTSLCDCIGLAGIYASSLLKFDVGQLPHDELKLSKLLESSGFCAQSKLASKMVAEGIADSEALISAIGQAGFTPLASKTRRVSYSAQAMPLLAAKRVSGAAKWSRHDTPDCSWTNKHLYSSFTLAGINGGASGVIMGLWLIGRLYRSSEFHATIVAAARWLKRNFHSVHAGGLFTGQAGAAVGLAIAGCISDDQDLKSEAWMRLQIAQQTDVLDLFSGQAGVGLAAIIVDNLIGDGRGRNIAEMAVRNVLEQGPREKNGFLGWPSSRNASDEDFLLGAAHGGAGIARAILQISRECNQAAAKCEAEAVLRRLTTVVLSDPLRRFPRSTNREVSAPTQWCHGLAGLLWALQFCDEATLPINSKQQLLGTLLNEPLPCDTTMCHGLSGLLESIATYCDSDEVRQHRNKIIRVLEALYNSELQEPPWYSENLLLSSPDLWIGSLGPATAIAIATRGQNTGVWDLKHFSCAL